ncbi:MAG: kelch repeat-containing protein [bacterium]|nr:kelch repeat-containing protein [bacterium]
MATSSELLSTSWLLLLRSSCFAAAVSVTVIAQDFRTLEVVGYQSAAYDHLRDRLTVLGPKNATFDYDGTARLRGPRLDAVVPVDLVFEEHTGSMLGVLRAFSGRLLAVRRDGLEWRYLAPPTTPPARNLFSLAYDSARAETVLFGGFNPTSNGLDETWVFDGVDWTQRSPAVSPPGRRGAAMAFDSTRGVVVLFGGYGTSAFGDTWEWNGTTWTQVQPIASPAGRQGAAMAYDPIRDRCVLYGGNNGAGFWYPQTWEYDAQTWVLRTNTPTGPAFREQSAFVWNPRVGRCELVGGKRAGNVLFDRWQWDGTVWHNSSLAMQPSDARFMAAFPGGDGVFAFTAADGVSAEATWRFDRSGWQQLAVATPSITAVHEPVVCSSPGAVYLLEATDPMTLHEFDGSNWRVASSTGPARRANVAMTYDWANGEVVVFGGGDGTQVFGETWTFDGVSWTQQAPANQPPARELGAMTYDPQLGRVVLAGGWSQIAWLNDTWQWSGTDWTAFPAMPSPPSDSVLLMEYDSTRSRIVAVTTSRLGGTLQVSTLEPSGWTSVGTGVNLGPNLFRVRSLIGLPYARGVLAIDDRGVHSLSAQVGTATDYGQACTVTAPLLTAREWPRLGSPDFGIDVTGAPASGIVAMLGADRQGPGGTVGNCPLLVQSGQAALLVQSNALGFATVPLPLPEILGFVGLDLYFQAAVLDVSAPSGFTTTRGLQVTLGH